MPNILPLALGVAILGCAQKPSDNPVPSAYSHGAKQVMQGLGVIHWGGGSAVAGKDSLWVYGQWNPAWTKDSSQRALAKALLGPGGDLIRLVVGPFDSLPVSGGMIRGVALRPFDLSGTSDSLGLVASMRRVPLLGRWRMGRRDTLDAEIRLGGSPWIWSDGARFRSVGSLSLKPTLRAVFDTSVAPILSRKASEITFAADDVEPNLERIPRVPDSSWRESRRPPFDDESRWVVGESGPNLVACEGTHAFAGTFVRAWNEHRPVRLSPDAVWMMLTEGLLRKVERDPEKCRHAMVRRKSGKDTLEVRLPDDFSSRMHRPDAWRPLATGLLDSMDRFVVGRRHRVMSRPFSTSTPARLMSSRLRVLQIYQAYFEFRGTTACGIPSITLEGTVEDWKDVRARLDTLGICGLERWRDRMAGILDEFVASAQGRPSRDFWKSFVRYTPTDPDCGESSKMDGWITQFFAANWSGKAEDPSLSSIELDLLPYDHGVFPVRVAFPGNREVRFQVGSGFAGIAQAADGALYPELGWFVWKPETKGQE